MTASTQSVTLATRLARSEDVLFQEVSGEAVLLDLASEQYFGLDPVGTRIWDLIGPDTSLSDIHESLCSEFGADPERIESDLLALTKTLLEAGLVRQI